MLDGFLFRDLLRVFEVVIATIRRIATWRVGQRPKPRIEQLGRKSCEPSRELRDTYILNSGDRTVDKASGHCT